MPEPRFNLGDGAIVDLWIGGRELVTIIDGPLMKDGKTLYKVRHVEYEMWYSEDRLTPCAADDFKDP